MAGVSYSIPHTARVGYLSAWGKLVVYLAAIAGAFYFPWRLTVFNPHALLLSLVLFAAESFGLVTIILHVFMTWRLLHREPPPPPPGQNVDVFIPTYNEPVEMLRRTVIAARDMKYPHKTWLLDDGDRAEMARLAAQLGVEYLSREDNKHAKAGNLNNALAHSEGGFIAIFDADHVPHEDYLVRTLGYFTDQNVAFVQTPQDFYNIDSFQHRRDSRANVVWSEQSLFFRVIMPGKDYWNAAFFCGSCATVRRSALQQIGGFATETVTEDLHTSIRLHKKGFGSVYHAESLAYGIAPDTFEPYESQRVRWGQGAMQVWRLEGILTGRGLTPAQRLCYLGSALTYFDGWQKAFMFLLPSFVLVTGILPIASVDLNFLARFLPWYLLSLCACEELGRGYARSWTIEQYNFLRSPGFAFATLTFFLNRRLRFRVTRKGSSSSRENARHMAPHLAVIAISLVSLIAGSARFAVAPQMTLGAMILNVVWCLVTLTISTVAVRFALRHSKQERASYRFRLPVPIRIHDSTGQSHLIRMDEISSGGFSATVPYAIPINPGKRLQADLILPSGPTRVTLDIRRNSPASGAGNQGGQILAARFNWLSPNDGDALDRYLYGSNAEWRFQRLAEKTKTPVGWIDALLHRRAKLLSSKSGVDWQPAIVVPKETDCMIEVLACTDDSPGRVHELLADSILNVWDTIALILPQGSNEIRYYDVESRHIQISAGRMMFRYGLCQIQTPQTGRSGQFPRQPAPVYPVESAA